MSFRRLIGISACFRPDGPRTRRKPIRRRSLGSRGSTIDHSGEPVGEFVHLEVKDAVATIRLDRPKMNAINGRLREELAEAAGLADADPAVRAVILYGGERVFAAGADIKE